MTNRKTLTLRKYAFYFDHSHFEESYKIKYPYDTAYQQNEPIYKEDQKTLKEFYNHPEKTAERIPYTVDKQNRIVITLNGRTHRLNDLQIAGIDEPGNVINHRRQIDPDEIIKELPHFYRFNKQGIHSNKFKTFYCDFFTNPDDLGYIRIHFKRYCVMFIIDDRNGDIYTAGTLGRHEPKSINYIFKNLGINSAAAKTELTELLQAITKTRVIV